MYLLSTMDNVSAKFITQNYQIKEHII
uniref:Uncharacterized protein n=1 Tax=Arundo donax TaxID=35708 RepID=A0A0A8Y7X7_ARUDO